MNGRLDPYVPVSVPNGYHESGSAIGNYDTLIDLSPPRCRVPSNPSHEDAVRDGQTPRMVYDSPSLPTNGVLYRNNTEATNMSHLSVHYWPGRHCVHLFTAQYIMTFLQPA